MDDFSYSKEGWACSFHVYGDKTARNTYWKEQKA